MRNGQGGAIILSMAPPKGTSAAVALPQALQPLAEQLVRLPPDDREKVIVAARAGANDAKPRLRTVSPEHMRAAFGIVSLGGNAVDDVNALYDG